MTVVWDLRRIADKSREQDLWGDLVEDGVRPKAASADALLGRCVSIDLEVDPKTDRLQSFAAVRPDVGEAFTHSRGDLSQALAGLDAYADGADFVLGHNIIHFDIRHLEAARRDLQRPWADGAVASLAEDEVVEEPGPDALLQGRGAGWWFGQGLGNLADVEVEVGIEGGAEDRGEDEEREGWDRDADQGEISLAAVDEEVDVFDPEGRDKSEGEVGEKREPVGAAGRGQRVDAGDLRLSCIGLSGSNSATPAVPKSW